MRAYDNREERLRMDLQGKKRYLIPLGLLLFVLLQSIPWNYLRYAAEVAGRFPEVDRAVVSVEGEAPPGRDRRGEVGTSHRGRPPGRPGGSGVPAAGFPCGGWMTEPGKERKNGRFDLQL